MASDIEHKLWDYRVNFSFDTSAFPMDEPEEYVVGVRGEVVYEPEDAEPSVVGEIRCTQIHGDRAVGDGYPLEDVFDATDEVFQIYTALCDKKRKSVKSSIQSRFEAYGDDMLYLSAIEIEASHQGFGLGLTVVSRAIDMLAMGTDSLVVCKPFPMQHDVIRREQPEWLQRYARDSFPTAADAAMTKLRSYWGRLGFKMIRGTEYALLSMNLKRPTLREALGLESD